MVRYFWLSPITMQLLSNFMWFNMRSSMGTGAMFSPPLVINSSLIRPVMYK